MNLTTKYLGLTLQTPLMPGASPLVNDLDIVRRLEDAGASAIVLHSLFEEEIHRDVGLHLLVESHAQSFAEALSFLPELQGYHLGPDRYLELIRRIKAVVKIPVIASLNGSTPGGWTGYAHQIQLAGADALELNIYLMANNPDETGAEIENRTIAIVRAVREATMLPLAVKIGPFYSSVSNLAVQLGNAGADGLVLFNRFYQPDIDIENFRVVPDLKLSTSEELRLRLRWLAFLHGQVNSSLAVSGGVHTIDDAIKSIAAGADAVQVVSALLKYGPQHLRLLIKGLESWMEQHGYESVDQLKGSMSHRTSPEPESFERANYIRVIDNWRLKD